jgi:ubiquinone/menaquinone biosynthesis C-methylase UbiE
VNLGQRYARFVTDVVTRQPRLWRLLRWTVRRQFDRIAPVWDEMRSPDAFAPVERALDALPGPPRRVLDLGTGTGSVAILVAERFPAAEAVGADVAPQMIEKARAKGSRVQFDVADAEHLPYADASFDLVTLGNMIPFFDELVRVTAPEGYVLFAFSAGAETPIYVPSSTLRTELDRRGFADFAEFSAGRGTSLLARKR